MKTLTIVSALVMATTCFAQIKVVQARGDVRFRHGVSEEWRAAATGDILRPEDSMRLGKGSSARVVVDGTRTIAIPENVIIDLSDFRTLSREDLLLKLAMERVRSVPASRDDRDPTVPQTTVIHGSEQGREGTLRRSVETGLLQLNGTRVLYGGGFYATCVLRLKEVFRLYPEFLTRYDIRLMVASALEKERLDGEALSEYSVLAAEDLSARDRAVVKSRIAQLKKKAR